MLGSCESSQVNARTSQRGGRAVSSPDYEQLPPLRLGVSPRGATATAHRWFIWITPTGANPWVLCLGMFAFSRLRR